MTIWFTSDFHIGHKRILELTDRPFDTVEEMNEALVRNHNEMVSPIDTTYFLGDMVMGGWRDNIHYIDRLNGKKILIVGNHDAPFTNARRGASKVAEVTDEYLHHFDEVFWEHKIDGFALSHFPYDGDSHGEDRHADHRPVDIGEPLVHGHVHSKDIVTKSTNGTFQYHVGVDAHDMRPVTFDTIKATYEWFIREGK